MMRQPETASTTPGQAAKPDLVVCRANHAELLGKLVGKVARQHVARSVHWNRQMERHIDEAIHHLPGFLKAAVICCDLEGCGIAEAAQLLGSSPVEVLRRLDQGRRQIREWLARWGLRLPIDGPLLRGLVRPESAGGTRPELPERVFAAAVRVVADRPDLLSERVTELVEQTSAMLE